MRVYLAAAMAVVLGLVGGLRAEPLNLKRVAADAKWVAHLDVDAMRDSVVAEKVHDYWHKTHPEAAKFLAKARLWNFNPSEDLFDVTLHGTRIKKDTGVVIVHAKVDQELLLKKARGAPGHRESAYGQYQLHTWKHAEGTRHAHDMTGVFYRPDVIVFGGSIDEVKAALDVLDGTGPNLAGKDSPLAEEIPPGTMFLARAVGLADAPDLPCKSPVVKQIDFMTLSIGENQANTFINGKVEIEQAKMAQQLRSVVEGARAMAILNNADDEEALKVINALNVTVEGNVIRLRWQAPAEKVWELLKKFKERKEAQIRAWRRHGKPGRHPAEDK